MSAPLIGANLFHLSDCMWNDRSTPEREAIQAV